MRRLTIIALTMFTLILGATLAQAAQEAPADLLLAPPAGMTATKALVAFSHAKHGAAKVECGSCHHKWDGKGEVIGCASSGCHDQPGKKDVTSYYTAFHSKMSDASCVACHKKAKDGGNGVVPVSCKQCHPK